MENGFLACHKGLGFQVGGGRGEGGHMTCKVFICFCCCLPLLTFPPNHPKISVFCLRMYSVQASYRSTSSFNCVIYSQCAGMSCCCFAVGLAWLLVSVQEDFLACSDNVAFKK